MSTFFSRDTLLSWMFFGQFSGKKTHCSQALCGRYMLESLLFQFFIHCSHDCIGNFSKIKTHFSYALFGQNLSKIRFFRLVCPCCYYFYSLKGFLLLFYAFLLSESAFSVQNCFVWGCP